MKPYILVPVLLLSLACVGFLVKGFKTNDSDNLSVGYIPVCGTVNTDRVGLSDDGRFIAAMPGWGNYSMAVTTKSDSSQYFFDQGLSMYYGYHFKEAVASFKEAARFDQNNAMAYWGQALAMGPYYNGAHTYTQPAEVMDVLEKMNENSGMVTQVEKQLIMTMNQRYSKDEGDLKRKELNIAYAEALKGLIQNNEEAKVLYIDAVMLMHAWDFWNLDGSPKEWTPELVRLCEDVLQNNPKHPGALHYHIHLTEASRQPQVALKSGEILKDLMPGIPHMVHMSSHAFERSGLYAEGVTVNNLADSNLVVYNQKAEHLGLNTFSSHYYAVQTYCALAGGMYTDALRYALRCRDSVKPSAAGTYDQYLYMLPVLTNVRMGKWEAILLDTEVISSDWVYASLISDFAKGMAHLYSGNKNKAITYLGNLRSKLDDPVLKTRRIPFNAPIQVALITEKLLDGAILYHDKKYAQAITSFEEAVRLEDQLIYTEPKDWPIPSRQFLGAYLVKNGQLDKAEKTYKEDLIKNPNNGWSLMGLSQAVNNDESITLKNQAKRAFAAADQFPETSVYME